ncbi:peptide ABC transporter substrate-binding protein [Salinithrix halophila]|uniref:Peptide ABC transporter substrate-binding protein n=1 Tax=Salinithrix halophila TaxID=1485204 RepID=A0ABV8JE55_9BACL
MRKTWTAVVSILFLVSTFAVGCGGGKDAGIEEKRRQLKLNLAAGEPTSLDPAKAFDGNSMEVVNNLYEGLTRLDKDSKPQPAVAEKIEKSADGKTYTFTLRDEAKWSNGEEVTAQDFAFAWKRVMDPKTASNASFLMNVIKNAEKYNAGKASAEEVGIHVRDDKTLIVELEQPTPYFEELTAYTPFVPVYKKGVKGKKYPFSEAKDFVTNGPFKMKSWKHEDNITAVKNDYYRKAEDVKLAGIEWSMVQEGTTAYQQFKMGEFHYLDNTSIPPDLQSKIIGKGEAKVSEAGGLDFYRFNVKEKPFTNAKIRRAFALAIDRRAIVDQVVQGKQQPAYAYVAPGTITESGDFREGGNQLIPENNLEEAKELLKEGMKEEGLDKLPQIEILYNKGDKNKKVAEAIQEMWRKNLHADVSLKAQEIKVFMENRSNGNFIVARSSFLPDYNDPYNYLESFQTGHPMNQTGWSDKEYDTLLKSAYKEVDESKRMQTLHRAEEVLMEQMPICPLYFYSDITMQKPEVKNILNHPVGPNDYRYTTIKG